jgi:2',3'-cyclic-nucleotide 2'-phosphodiesterase (5'-nucleotidase family)
MVRKSVTELRDQVDLIVVLTHQGKTAPMQTDAESDPRLQRDIDVDIELAGAVEGIDVLLAGHADAGTPEAVVNEKTGTLIMQTYGQATHLGFLQLTLDGETGEIIGHDGKLIPVDSSRWQPDSAVAAKLQKYRAAYPELMQIVGETSARMNRLYIEESDVGNLFADAFVEASGADIGFVHSGSLRKDLPGGEVRLVDLLDTYPFVDDVIIKEMTGDQIRRALEQSLTLERGLLQLSGLNMTYDLLRPEQQRIVSLERNGKAVVAGDLFTVAAPGFLAEGGDLYDSFAESAAQGDVGQVSDVMIEYFRKHEVVAVPTRGRQKDLSQ